MVSWISNNIGKIRHGADPVIGPYLRAYAHRPQTGKAWQDLRFVVMDTETTGLDPSADQILSIGAIVVQHGAIHVADSLELSLVSSQVTQVSAIPIHGILAQENLQGMEEKVALLEFLRYLRADVLVGHHADFDAAMVESGLRKYYPGFRLHNWRIDTAQLAMRAEQPDWQAYRFRAQDYSLDKLCDKYDIRKTDRHTATGDAYLTSILLLKLLSEMKSQRRLSLRSLLEY
ncbi:MAG: 3'-5' exonuclease [Bacteroidia bacterium]|nr:3'-5' exonuclease [Bacteroidia bacterium]